MDDIPIIPVVYVHRLAELMREEGFDTAGLLREAGINPNLMTRPDTLLTLRQGHALARRYMGLSPRPLPALRYGQSLDLIAHGLLGHVYLWQGDFRRLIESIMVYMRVRLPILTLELTEGPDYFGVRLACTVDNRDAQVFLLQAFIGSLHTLCSTVTRNIVLHCRHDLFSDPAAAQALLKTELNSDHDCNEMRFYPATVHLQGDTAAPSAAAPEARREKKEKSEDPYEEPGLVVRLRNQLLSHLRGDDSAENIASSLGMSVRTLRRRLADCGMNFNKVRLDVRMEVAMRYLTTTSISIERIAGYVGYSDQATFTRAFREWKGDTPYNIRHLRVRSLRSHDDLPGATATTEHDAGLPRPG